MKNLTIRIDDSLLEIITKNADGQKIKVSRYIRMLIEKGLVVDAQLQGNMDKFSSNINNNIKSVFDIRMAQIQTESLLICREILKKTLSSDVDFSKKTAELSDKATKFVTKALGAEEDLS